jgi:hypothetical protein
MSPSHIALPFDVRLGELLAAHDATPPVAFER